MIKEILSKLKRKNSKSVKSVKTVASKKASKKTTKKSGKRGKVILYSTKTCQWCAKTKAFFKANKVSFTSKDVGSNKAAAQEMIKKSGQQSVPVVDVGGKIIVGFNEGKLKSALGL